MEAFSHKRESNPKVSTCIEINGYDYSEGQREKDYGFGLSTMAIKYSTERIRKPFELVVITFNKLL